SAVAISKEETDYLCGAVSEDFAAAVSPADIVWSYAGVRSLFDDGEPSAQNATRDFVLDLDARPGEPPLVTIIGGRITTSGQVAAVVVSRLRGLFPHARPARTPGVPLPGGNFAYDPPERLPAELAAAVPALGEATAGRLVRTYGTMARAIFAAVDP